MYRPNVTICGAFQIFRTEASKAGTASGNLKTVGDVMATYHMGKQLTEEDRKRIPDIPPHYLVSKDAENILRKVTRTDMRIFMLRGEARDREKQRRYRSSQDVWDCPIIIFAVERERKKRI